MLVQKWTAFGSLPATRGLVLAVVRASGLPRNNANLASEDEKPPRQKHASAAATDVKVCPRRNQLLQTPPIGVQRRLCSVCKWSRSMATEHVHVKIGIRL